MSHLIGFYPGDGAAQAIFVAVLGVTLVSSAGWLISRRLAGRPAVRHLVLSCSLVCSAVFPFAVWVWAAAGVTLVSVPIFGARQGSVDPAARPIEAYALVVTPPPSGELARIASSSPPVKTTKTADSRPIEIVSPRLNRNEGAARGGEVDSALSRERGTTGGTVRSIASLCLLVWAAGTLLLLVRLARNCVGVVQLRRASRAVDDVRVQALLQGVVGQLGVRRAPILFVTSEPIAPLAVALGRPAVVLPERLLKAIDEDELRDILVHEVAHLERGDLTIVLLQEIVGAVYWPILTIHALNREMRKRVKRSAITSCSLVAMRLAMAELCCTSPNY